jgi:hypothetical protein
LFTISSPPECATLSRGFLRPHVAGYGDEPAAWLQDSYRCNNVAGAKIL